VAASRFLIVGNPENRRVAFFQAALAREGLAPARVLSWLDLLTGRASLARALAPGTILRLESPGESFAVERELIARGAGEPDARIDAALARTLEPDHGRILHPRQWYAGWRSVLEECALALAAAPTCVAMSAPREIAMMFDKRACHARCERGGVPVPRALGPVSSYDHLRERMRESGQRRVFVKLASGSSASGVVALETRGAGEQARTSVELVRAGGEVRLYNSLRVRRYTDPREIAAIVDALAPEGVHVEEWIPKAGIEGEAFDLRLVVIGGEAHHVVVRLSRSPMTNLHLGNKRGDPALVRERLGEALWAEVHRTAAATGRLFPGTTSMGVDLLVDSSHERHAILEVNAFGDLLPNVLHEGRDTYATEVAALASVLA
jgi:glutathione synthase/RimK-type ligase-like ATP-grasp enzyme